MTDLSEALQPMVLRGRYCHITCEYFRSNGNHQHWNLNFNWIGIGSEKGTEEEQIASFISGLPDAKLLEGAHNLHYGVLQILVGLKDSFISIAQCFLGTKGEFNDPLLKLLNEGAIDR